jgi:hypothetical protein
MIPNPTSFADLPDDELLAEVKRLAATERCATAALIRSLIEVDARRLCLGEGCSSLFTYCTQVLHLSESAAYNRMEAARAARRFPEVLTALEDGSLTLTAVRLLAPHVTPDNCASVLASRTPPEQTGDRATGGNAQPETGGPRAGAKAASGASRRHRRGAPRSGPIARAERGCRADADDRTVAWGGPRLTASDDRGAGPGPLQGPAHGLARDVRQAAPRAGSVAARGSKR